METDKSQADKFKEAARKAEADENESAWEARLKKIAKPKPPRLAAPSEQ